MIQRPFARTTPVSRDLHGNIRKQRAYEIREENFRLAERIRDVRHDVDFKRTERDFQSHQRALKNLAKIRPKQSPSKSPGHPPGAPPHHSSMPRQASNIAAQASPQYTRSCPVLPPIASPVPKPTPKLKPTPKPKPVLKPEEAADAKPTAVVAGPKNPTLVESIAEDAAKAQPEDAADSKPTAVPAAPKNPTLVESIAEDLVHKMVEDSEDALQEDVLEAESVAPRSLNTSSEFSHDALCASKNNTATDFFQPSDSMSPIEETSGQQDSSPRKDTEEKWTEDAKSLSERSPDVGGTAAQDEAVQSSGAAFTSPEEMQPVDSIPLPVSTPD